MEVLLFILRYKIKKDKTILSKHCEDFFKLSNTSQNKVLDKYFHNLEIR